MFIVEQNNFIIRLFKKAYFYQDEQIFSAYLIPSRGFFQIEIENTRFLFPADISNLETYTQDNISISTKNDVMTCIFH